MKCNFRFFFRLLFLSSSTYRVGPRPSEVSAETFSPQFQDSVKASSDSLKEDSTDWVWSESACNIEGKTEKNSKINLSSSDVKNLNARPNDSLIDFADHQTKFANVSTSVSSTATVPTKSRTAEEEAWDLLNS